MSNWHSASMSLRQNIAERNSARTTDGRMEHKNNALSNDDIITIEAAVIRHTSVLAMWSPYLHMRRKYQKRSHTRQCRLVRLTWLVMLSCSRRTHVCWLCRHAGIARRYAAAGRHRTATWFQKLTALNLHQHVHT